MPQIVGLLYCLGQAPLNEGTAQKCCIGENIEASNLETLTRGVERIDEGETDLSTTNRFV